MIYLASPYTHPDQKIRNERASEAALFAGYCIITNGQVIFSPIVYGHSIIQQYKVHQVPTDADWWWEFNLEFLKISEQVYVLALPGWSVSTGVSKELKTATMLEIPISIYEKTANKNYMLVEDKDYASRHCNQ